MIAKFQMLQIGITTQAAQELAESQDDEGMIKVGLRTLIARHASGDWGDVDAHDKRTNDQALKTGARIVSAYKLFGVKLWVISDAAHGNDPTIREVTTILRPADY